MAYFSLLYQTIQQETQMKQEAEQQLFINGKRDHKRRFQIVGSKMVAITEPTMEARKLPCYFIDLGIDQIVSKILLGDTNDESAGLFTELIKEKSLIRYRQNIFKDLDNPLIKEMIVKFQISIIQIIKLKEYSIQANHPIQKSKYLLDAMEMYQENILDLINGLEGQTLSEGLSHMHQVLKDICLRTDFTQFRSQVKKIKQKIDDIHYSLIVQSDRIKVCFETNDYDYSDSLRKLFGRCDKPLIPVSSHNSDSNLNRLSFFQNITMNDLELKILNVVDKRYPSLFKECMALTSDFNEFPEVAVMRIYKEMKFYLSCQDYVNSYKDKGFHFTFPEIDEEHLLELEGLYDVNLALTMEVITNDFMLQDGENGAWITGANQGGKTTFVRSIGQTIYFALIGLPVPACHARIPLFHSILTHFSSEEDAIKSNGKLKEELLHLKELLDSAPRGKNLMLLNELFSSATSSDAYEMSQLLVKQLIASNFTVLLVTHIPMLASKDDGMVSIGTQMNKSQTHDRTYKLVRKDAEATAYAEDIANKYGLSFENIKERLGHDC